MGILENKPYFFTGKVRYFYIFVMDQAFCLLLAMLFFFTCAQTHKSNNWSAFFPTK